MEKEQRQRRGDIFEQATMTKENSVEAQPASKKAPARRADMLEQHMLQADSDLNMSSLTISPFDS